MLSISINPITKRFTAVATRSTNKTTIISRLCSVWKSTRCINPISAALAISATDTAATTTRGFSSSRGTTSSSFHSRSFLRTPNNRPLQQQQANFLGVPILNFAKGVRSILWSEIAKLGGDLDQTKKKKKSDNNKSKSNTSSSSLLVDTSQIDPRKELSVKAFLEKVSQELPDCTDANRAFQLYKEAVKLFETNLDVRLCTQVLNVIGKRAKRPKDALALWEDMKLRNVKPNTVLYNTVINLCKYTKDTETAMDLFNKLCDHQSQHQQPTEEVFSSDPDENKKLAKLYRFAPDTLTFNALLDVFAEAGDPRIYKIFEHMKQTAAAAAASASSSSSTATVVKPDSTTYSTVIKGCNRLRDYATAMRLYEEMKNSGIEIDTVTYGTLIDICAIRRDTETAVKLWMEMKQVYDSKKAAAAAEKLKKVVKKKGASWEQFAKMQQQQQQQPQEEEDDPEDPTRNIILYNSLLKVFSADYDIFEMFEELKKRGEPKPTARTYSIMINACCNAICGRMTGSNKDDGSNGSNGSNGSSKKKKRNRDRKKKDEEDRQWLEKGFAYADEMKAQGLQPDAVVYSTLLELCYQCYHSRDRAEALLKEIKKSGIERDQILEQKMEKLLDALAERRRKSLQKQQQPEQQQQQQQQQDPSVRSSSKRMSAKNKNNSNSNSNTTTTRTSKDNKKTSNKDKIKNITNASPKQNKKQKQKQKQ